MEKLKFLFLVQIPSSWVAKCAENNKQLSGQYLGLEGETGLWTTDLETGTITSVSSSSADDPHITGRFNTRGVSVPMVAETAGPFSGGFYGK